MTVVNRPGNCAQRYTLGRHGRDEEMIVPLSVPTEEKCLASASMTGIRNKVVVFELLNFEGVPGRNLKAEQVMCQKVGITGSDNSPCPTRRIQIVPKKL